jgi:hypothetical protein
VNETELRNELRRGLDVAPVWPLAPDPAVRRADRRRRRRMVLTIASVVVALGVTAGSLIGLAAFRHGPASLSIVPPPHHGRSGPATTSPPTTRPPGTEATFTCDGTDIRPADLTVQPGRAGIGIVVDNTTGTRMGFTYPNGGTNAPPGVHPVEYPAGGEAWPVPPGDYVVKCVPDSVSDPDMVGGATLHVVDPNGMWVSSDLQCQTDKGFGGVGDYIPGAGESLEHAVHEALDGYAIEGDVIEHVGYPAATSPMYVLVRSGQAIVRATIRHAGKDAWLPDEVTGCSGEDRTKDGFHAPIRER